MSTIEESIDLEVPVTIATRRWDQFGEFPSDAEVTFLELDDHHTRVIVQMAYEPRTLQEAADNAAGIHDRRITDDLESFKDFIERRAA